MAVVRLTAAARRDAFDILNTLEAKAGTKVALRYADKFEMAFDSIAAFPGIGAPRSRFGEDVRMVVIAPYLVFYAGGSASEIVPVLRILHGRRRITRRVINEGRDG